MIREGVRMVNNDLRVLTGLKKGDFVYASFARIDDTADMVEGWVQKVNNESIVIMERNPKNGPKVEYGIWQMTSLICKKKDITFCREGNVFLNVERLSAML